MRLRTWAPVRRLGAALEAAGSGARRVAGFYGGVAQALPVHRALMLLTVAAFAAQSKAGAAAMYAGARVNVAILNGGQWHRLVSPVFLHGGGMHLASNLFSLYRIGPLVESAYGPARTALLYMLSGIGGNLAGLAFGPLRGMSVGASGAVFGMMGGAVAFALGNRQRLGRYSDAIVTNVGQVRAAAADGCRSERRLESFKLHTARI